jgi:hypothetical protein
MLRLVFLLNVATVGLFYGPGWLLLKVLSLGRYPPRGEPHSVAFVALTGLVLVVTLLVVLT